MAAMAGHGSSPTSPTPSRQRFALKLGDPYDFRMPLELAERLLPEWVRDLGVDPPVLDVLVAEVVGDVLNPAAGVEEMYGDRVPE